jgi:hypothetical protein
MHAVTRLAIDGGKINATEYLIVNLKLPGSRNKLQRAKHCTMKEARDATFAIC